MRDPIARMRTRLIGEGILTVAEIDELERRLEHEAAEAAERALQAPLPEVEGITTHVYSEDLDPTRAAFATEQPQCSAEANGAAAAGGQKGAGARTMADLINVCLRDEMRRDPRIVVYGEDVADASRAEALAEVKGKGGVFKLTAGLQTEFGSERVFNSPLAEANIVGRAVGYALRGMKPVVEIQFFDYIWPAMHQIHNELALMRWRSNGAWADAGGHSRAHRRLSDGRRHLPLAIGRKHLHAHSGAARGVPLERARRQRPAAHGHSLRRPGAVSRAQAALSRDLWPRGVSGAGVRHSLREGEDRSSRHGPHAGHVWRAGAARDAGCAAGAARARHRH